jgi:hypothetical protein
MSSGHTCIPSLDESRIGQGNLYIVQALFASCESITTSNLARYRINKTTTQSSCIWLEGT